MKWRDSTRWAGLWLTLTCCLCTCKAEFGLYWFIWKNFSQAIWVKPIWVNKPAWDLFFYFFFFLREMDEVIIRVLRGKNISVYKCDSWEWSCEELGVRLDYRFGSLPVQHNLWFSTTSCAGLKAVLWWWLGVKYTWHLSFYRLHYGVCGIFAFPARGEPYSQVCQPCWDRGFPGSGLRCACAGFGIVTRGCCGEIWCCPSLVSGLEGRLAGKALPPAPSHGHRGAARDFPPGRTPAVRCPLLPGLREARGIAVPRTRWRRPWVRPVGGVSAAAWGHLPIPAPCFPSRVDGWTGAAGRESVRAASPPRPVLSRPERAALGVSRRPMRWAAAGWGRGPPAAGAAAPAAPGRRLPVGRASCRCCCAPRSGACGPAPAARVSRDGAAGTSGQPPGSGFRLGGFNFGTFWGKWRRALPAGRRMLRRGCGWHCRWGRGFPAQGGGGEGERQRRTGRGEPARVGVHRCLGTGALAAGVPFLRGDGLAWGGCARWWLLAGNGGAGTGEFARGRGSGGAGRHSAGQGRLPVSCKPWPQCAYFVA